MANNDWLNSVQKLQKLNDPQLTSLSSLGLFGRDTQADRAFKARQALGQLAVQGGLQGTGWASPLATLAGSIAMGYNPVDRSEQDQQSSFLQDLAKQQEADKQRQGELRTRIQQAVNSSDPKGEIGKLFADYPDQSELINRMGGFFQKDENADRADKRDRFDRSFKFGKDFENRPEVKDYITVKTNIGIMNELVNSALSDSSKQNLVGVDQGLISIFNKLTDPASVVRESEYARTPENLPYVNRMIGAIQKLQRGGAGLTNDDRMALLMSAKIIGNERGKQYEISRSRISDLANKNEIDSEMATMGMGQFQPFDMTVQAPPVQSMAKKNTFVPAPIIEEVDPKTGKKVFSTGRRNITPPAGSVAGGTYRKLWE